MAQASLAHRRTSARRAAIRAKERRKKVLAIVLIVVLAALLAYQLPHLLSRGSSSSAKAGAAATPSGTPLAARKVPGFLRGRGSGVDPFAARAIGDLDARIAPGGGRDPFAALLERAAAASTQASSVTLPQRIVIGTPGAHKHLVKGWIVILASIPVGSGHSTAVRFARGVHGLGAVSVLNSSNRRPLRGGYWVVYTGPVKTLAAVSRLASTVHSAGYRTAYIRQLYQYR
jgi:hypothetical protein